VSFNPGLTLNAIVVNLIATHDGRVPLTQGALAHAAFLDLVHAADPDLADRLHDSGARQPFTLSPLRDLPAPRSTGVAAVPAPIGATTEGRPYELRAGHRASLRLTLLDPDLFMAFLRRLLAAGPDLRLRIGDVTFAVESAIGAPGSHPWAGYTTAGELRDRAGTEPRIRLLFASPTAINLGQKDAAKQRMILIPAPRFIFGALRGTWNRSTGDEIPLAFETWVDEFVFVREVRNWQTAVYQLKRGVHPGGFGDVSFEALDRDAVHLRTLNLLADFAFYSGIGSKTTMGMGQARRL
jgi:CRISPR-associated endoribonuclease Cas6